MGINNNKYVFSSGTVTSHSHRAIKPGSHLQLYLWPIRLEHHKTHIFHNDEVMLIPSTWTLYVATYVYFIWNCLVTFVTAILESINDISSSTQ